MAQALAPAPAAGQPQAQQQQAPGSPEQQQQQVAGTSSAVAKGPDVQAVDEDIRIIGLGQRGISATLRLMCEWHVAVRNC
jgi:hypothetical protein